MSDTRLAGFGKTLSEIRDSLFGSSPSAKAFRAVTKAMDKGDPYDPALIPLTIPVIRDLAGSQEFKAGWSEFGNELLWKHVQNPVTFLESLSWQVPRIKKWLDFEMGGQAKRFSRETSSFLKEWVNTNGSVLPTPSNETIQELKAFRPKSTQILYRGIRFHDIGELVLFHQTYSGTGKAFPFNSNWYSSWSKSMRVAEKFGRYSADSSQGGAMLSWLGRAKANKDYSGSGGYVIGARVAPDQCLVDLTNPDLPFGGGQHGGEGEVIVLKNTPLVCKVYAIFGDVEREVAELLGSKWNAPKTPGEDYFFSYLGPFAVDEVVGDETSGKVVFKMLPKEQWFGNREGLLTPRAVSEGSEGRFPVIPQFRKNLYEARWIDDFTVAYKRMGVATKQRVAAQYWRSPS